MNYYIDYQVNEDHIDIQGIMDGLYYPFYMEDCRHKFVKEVLHFDIEEEAKKGINMVLTGYTLKFLRPLKSGDVFQVNCVLLRDQSSNAKLHLKQGIYLNNKLYTEAVFTATCVPAAGGRPFLPESIIALLAAAPDHA